MKNSYSDINLAKRAYKRQIKRKKDAWLVVKYFLDHALVSCDEKYSRSVYKALDKLK